MEAAAAAAGKPAGAAGEHERRLLPADHRGEEVPVARDQQQRIQPRLPRPLPLLEQPFQLAARAEEHRL